MSDQERPGRSGQDDPDAQPQESRFDDRPSPEGDREPLSRREAEVMGFQVPRDIPGVRAIDETVYGEADGVEREDQYDANRAGPD